MSDFKKYSYSELKEFNNSQNFGKLARHISECYLEIDRLKKIEEGLELQQIADRQNDERN